MQDYLSGLNDAQRQAVEHVEGPVMILAGAGSGKTRALTFRIAHLLHIGVDAFSILSLTFTNKAAREMRERVEQIIGAEARNLWMGTFHSVFSKILRFEAELIGYPKNFTIYDTDDTKSLLKAIVKEKGYNKDTYKPGFLYSRISSLKNSFISVREYLGNPDYHADDRLNGRPAIGEIYREYVARCFKAGAMDFDDILLKTYQLFQEHPEALNKYQHKFKYILVDEYQDTNHVQYLIIKKLAAVNQNICVVGDDAQSIYAFRGANIKNILDFERDYPNLSVYKLEQNYRSTQNIVNAASDVIQQNREQLKKNIWTHNDHGEKIMVFKAGSEGDEGRLVAQSIFEEKMSSHRSNSEFAVLYRTNSQSRSFEEALRKIGLPYRIVGGLSFYQRKEIKDLLAYFRLAVNPIDEEALKRVINYPTRGIGKTTLDQMITLAAELDKPLWDIVSHATELPFAPAAGRKLVEFSALIKSFAAQVQREDAYEAALHIAKASTLMKKLFEDKSVEGIARYENLQDLLAGIKEFVEREEQEEKSLPAFMEDVALLTDADVQDDGEDKVTLMTIHGAKGLEFPYVYIVGMEENLFPSQLSLQSREELEEERRLFYVALTRAMTRASLSYAQQRFRWGTLTFAEPSRFIDEISSQYLDYQMPLGSITRPGGFGARSASVSASGAETRLKDVTPNRPMRSVARAGLKTPVDFVPDRPDKLKEGMEVEHSRFGSGKISHIEGQGDNRKAVIEFKDFGQKQILLKFAKLKIKK